MADEKLELSREANQCVRAIDKLLKQTYGLDLSMENTTKLIAMVQIGMDQRIDKLKEMGELGIQPDWLDNMNYTIHHQAGVKESYVLEVDALKPVSGKDLEEAIDKVNDYIRSTEYTHNHEAPKIIRISQVDDVVTISGNHGTLDTMMLDDLGPVLLSKRIISALLKQLLTREQRDALLESYILS